MIKAKDETKWYNKSISSEDSNSDSPSEKDNGNDWMVNYATDIDKGARVALDDPMDNWIQSPNEERPKTFSSKQYMTLLTIKKLTIMCKHQKTTIVV